MAIDVDDLRRDHIRYRNELWGGEYCRTDNYRWPCPMTLALDEIVRLEAALHEMMKIWRAPPSE